MKHLTGILLAVVVLATTAAGQGRVADWSLPHEPGRLLLIRADGVDEQRIMAWHAFQGLGILKKLRGDHAIHLAELPEGQVAQELAARFENSGLFRVVEPDYLFQSSALEPDDPAYADGELWGLENTGQRNGTADADIDASDAWDTITSAEDIIVGVIDTGVRYTHLDLRDNMWVNPGEIAGNNIDDDRNGVIDDVHGFNGIDESGDPMDDNGHGTHCSGTIGAVGNNGIGTVGVAWNVKIMGLKFLRANGSGATSDAIKCISYAQEQGVDVINASWGGSGYSAALENAIELLKEDGIIFVAAAGNDNVSLDMFNGQSAQYPAALTNANIITVASTTRNDSRSSFSNVGRFSVDLGAPGSRIYSTWFDSDISYHTIDGTSMAAPHVAGAVALLRALRPTAPYQQIISTLYDTVDPLPQLADITVTGGRLNIGSAVNALSSFESPELTGLTISEGTLSPPFNSGTFSYAAAVPNETTSVTVTPTAAQETSIIVGGALVVSGQPSLPQELAVGENEILIQLFAADQAESSYSIVVTRTTPPPPVLTDLTISDGTLSPPFDSGSANYAVTVPNETTSMTVTPTAAPGTSIIVGGALVASGQPSPAQNLNVGQNEIRIRLFAGSTSLYSVVVTREVGQTSELTVIQDPVGNATRILNLEVDGVLYNVELKREFGSDIFTLPLIFDSEPKALAAVQAVSDALNQHSEITTVNQFTNSFYDIPFDHSVTSGWSVRSAEYFPTAGGWQPLTGSALVPNLSSSSFAIFTEVVTQPDLLILSLTPVQVSTPVEVWFTLDGNPGETYVIEASLNLSPGDWQSVTSVTLDETGVFEASFPADPEIGERYYRARLSVPE